jgi:hypothetical protein
MWSIAITIGTMRRAVRSSLTRPGSSATPICLRTWPCRRPPPSSRK